MALDSDSTLTDALDQYNDNLVWEGSPTKATLALESVRWLLINRPKITADAGSSISFEDLAAEKARLQRYVDQVAQASKRAPFVRGRAV